MIRTEKEICSQEAYYFYNDGIKALKDRDIKEAEHCFTMAEEYLKDGKIKYTGTGKNLSWSEWNNIFINRLADEAWIAETL